MLLYRFWGCPLAAWLQGTSIMRRQDGACSKPSLLLGVLGEH